MTSSGRAKYASTPGASGSLCRRASRARSYGVSGFEGERHDNVHVAREAGLAVVHRRVGAADHVREAEAVQDLNEISEQLGLCHPWDQTWPKKTRYSALRTRSSRRSRSAPGTISTIAVTEAICIS